MPGARRGRRGRAPALIALATYDELPGLDPDDAPLVAALREQGVEPRPAVWSDPDVDWSAFDLCLLRSVWDYFHRPAEFLDWIARAAEQVPIWNPPETVRWNAHKSYLGDLAARGVSVIPTVWAQRGGAADIAAILAGQDWDDAVIKPAIAGGSLGLHRVGDLEAAQAHLDGVLARGDAMIQPFLPSIDQGELSVICIDGEPCHAVRKTPRAGDIRVQPEHGGVVERAEPDEAELAVVRATLAALEHPALYARVDLVRDTEGEPLLIELECIEPRLFLAQGPETAARVARAVVARL